MDPKWYKAHGRLAAAREVLDHFELAIESYKMAATLAPEQSQKRESEASAARLHKKFQAELGLPIAGMDGARQDSLQPWKRVERLEQRGVVFPLDSSAMRSLRAYSAVGDAWKVRRLYIYQLVFRSLS